MQRVQGKAPFALMALLLTLSSCELTTQDPAPPDVRPASNVIINEVFTLPIDNPNFHSWIEFYNPTSDTVELTNWTLTLQTLRLSNTITVSVDSLGNFLGFTFLTQPDSFGTFDVPFAEGVFDIPGQVEDTVRLPPNELFTIVSSEDRMLTYTNWGPEDPAYRREREAFQGPIESIDTVSTSDTLTVLSVVSKSYVFYFDRTQQLVLKNPSGQVMDVVRIGDYTYSGPGTDPWPGNHTWGIIPEYETIQRWAGGYYTGNTANDFYPTNAAVRPLPHGKSQKAK
jgi:hypothetical protein